MAGGGFMDNARKVTQEHRAQRLRRKANYVNAHQATGILKNEPTKLHNDKKDSEYLREIRIRGKANQRHEILVFVVALMLTLSLFVGIVLWLF